MLGGDRHLHNHQRTAVSFLSAIRAEKPSLDIFECYEFEDVQRLTKQTSAYLTAFPDIRAVYCNNLRSTLIACEMLSSMSARPLLVGTDVHQELMPYFESGVLRASIYQNPRLQAYKALWNLYNLVTSEEKVAETTKVNIGIAIRANAASYLEDMD